MRNVLFALGLVTAVAACDRGSAPAAKAVAELPTLSVEQLASQLPGKTRPVDANGDRTRKDIGFIPGAILLSDYETYAASELPADHGEPLVFYCANEQCDASHEAAKKAVALGYRDVKVLPAGIIGWSKSQRVDKL